MAALRWIQARCAEVTSVFMALMFLAFIAQIVFRYVLNLPLDWTLEICLTMWLWVVFWGTAFIMEDEDHVRFDIVYQGRSERGRRILSFIYSSCIVAGFAASLPATYDYISFLKIKPSITLGIRLDLVFSCYLIFAVAVILQYLLRIWRIVTGRPFEAMSFYSAEMVAAEALDTKRV